MPTQFWIASFSGVLAGALGGALTVLLCLMSNRAAKLIEEYLRSVPELWEFYAVDYPSVSVAKK